MWLSLVERLVRDQEAGGSNPLTQTKTKRWEFPVFFVLRLRCVEPTASQGTNSGPRGNKVKTVRGSVFTAVSTAEQGASEVGEYRRAMRLCERCGPREVQILSLRPYRVFITDVRNTRYFFACIYLIFDCLEQIRLLFFFCG